MAFKKKTGIKDPFAEREAIKYQNPIPSRECILAWMVERGKPCGFEVLSRALLLKEDPNQEEGLRRRLKAMLRDGQLLKNRRGAYAVAESLQMVRGRVQAHKDGYGFVIPDDGNEDVFLNAREMRSLFNGDVVLVRVIQSDQRGRLEGQLVEILERHTTQLVGKFMQEEGIAYVMPESKSIRRAILIPADFTMGAMVGQIVVVTITVYPEEHRQAMGKIIEVVGEHMGPGMEVDVAIRGHNLLHIWSDLVLDEVKHFTPEVSEADKKNRVDLRHLAFVTIDGDDARDFDDAVYCEKTKTGWTLWVAIADVSHYVTPKTALDEEALNRGNSVYFPGRVIPMLPPILSDQLCSLRPHTDRLCFVAEMSISETGSLIDYRFMESVMHSQARLTYDSVAAWLHDPVVFESQPKMVMDNLQHLFDLFRVLLVARDERGAIDFASTETRMIFCDNRKIEKIIPVVRNDAHRMIEECMLLANTAAAQCLLKAKIPTLYRVHEAPPASRLQDVRDFLKEFHVGLGGGETPQAKDYLQLIMQIRDRPESRLLQTVLLRSLSQAVYSPENKGHFGLALDAYTHFTSPIRRYPDLLVHRALKYVLTHQSIDAWMYDVHAMFHLGEHCSYTERRADDATREAVAWLKCEFMLDHVGETFNGIITSVTSFGLFVELNDFYVEGLVHVTHLPNDYYQYDAVHHRMLGERTGMIYRLGDNIQVRVSRVDLDQRKIDFDCGDQYKKSDKKTVLMPTKKSPKKSREKSLEKSPKKSKATSKNPDSTPIKEIASKKRRSRKKKKSTE